MKLSKSHDPDWPCDLPTPGGLGLLPQQRVDRLPVLDMQLNQWGWWMNEMFTHAEKAAQVRPLVFQPP